MTIAVAKDVVAVAECGCVRGWISGKEWPLDREMKNEIARWARAGYEILRRTTEEAKAMPWECQAPKHPGKARKA